MSKQSGLGDNLYVSGVNLSGDTGSLGRISGGLAGTQDVTGIDKLAYERLGLLRDGALEWTAFFNPTAGAAHPTLKTLPVTDVQLMYTRGTTLGNPAATMIAKQIGYDPTRAADGSLTIGVQALPNGFGLEWGKLLTAGIKTDTAAAIGTGVDFTAGAAFGLQAWLQVLSFTGTDVTVKLQSSTDNGVGDAYSDVAGGGFTAVTSGPQVQRIQTARTQAIERWLRVVTTTVGGFSNLQYAVMVNVNPVSVVF